MNFYINNYNINISINDNSIIFVNIINKTTFQNYESLFVQKDICNFMNINEMYNFMIKCFSKDQYYNIDFEASENKLILFFNAKIDNFLNIAHKLVVKELILHSDKMLTTRINSMKESYETHINDLTLKINDLTLKINDLLEEKITIACGNRNSSTVNTYFQVNKYTNILNLTKYNNNTDIIWTHISLLPKLNELIINNTLITSNDNVNKQQSTSWQLYNEIILYDQGGHGLIHKNFFDIFNFPQITILEIIQTVSNNITEFGYMYNVPNLEVLRLRNFSGAVTLLTYIKPLCKLKEIQLINTNTINELALFRDYCLQNSIKLMRSFRRRTWSDLCFHPHHLWILSLRKKIISLLKQDIGRDKKYFSRNS